MDDITLVDTRSIPQTLLIHLSFHLIATLNVTAEDARRQVLTELGTDLVTCDPELVIAGERIIWRETLRTQG